MSRRMIDSRMWKSRKFKTLPAMARLMQIVLINIADDQGRCMAHPEYIIAEAFLYERVTTEEIQVWLSLMVQNGTILLYQADGEDYLQFINWWEYQTLTFARPSDYPAPDGWLDRICVNGKANIPLTFNWYKADGTRADDTCDAAGRPFPFILERIAAKQKGKKAPAKARESAKVEDKDYTQVYTLDYTQVIPEVKQQQLNNKQTTTEVEQENNNNSDALRALLLAEAETAVVVVGPGQLIDDLDNDQKMALLSWLWLYNGWYQDDLSRQDQFRRAYRRDPFLGMNSPGAVIVAQARAGTPAPLIADDREAMIAKLRELQSEVQP